MSAEPLCVAPRDVLTPIDDMDQHFLVSLAKVGSAEPPVRLVYLTPVTGGEDPVMREVLWWVAADAWVLERTNHDLADWAATYGYAATDEAAKWLFEQARRQAMALARLLGPADMKRLLALYEAEVGPSRS